ncbi:MAG: hypothetical protein ACREYE_27140 [Gammaproteobacteria bacterium]
MTQSVAPPCSDATVKEATKRDWQEWCLLLDARGASKLSHTDLARLVAKLHDAGGWWSQAVAVGYERLRGKRELFGRSDGTFTANVSKILSAESSEIYKRIFNDRMRNKWAPVRLEVRSATPYNTIRFNSKDGAKVAAFLQVKPNGKTSIVVEIAKLPSSEAVALVKEQWKTGLQKLAQALERE